MSRVSKNPNLNNIDYKMLEHCIPQRTFPSPFASRASASIFTVSSGIGTSGFSPIAGAILISTALSSAGSCKTRMRTTSIIEVVLAYQDPAFVFVNEGEHFLE